MKTSEEADLEFLSLANEKGRFALEVGLVMAIELQAAFERGIDHQWFCFVDLSTLAASGPRPMRVFKLTHAGWARKRVLERILRRPQDQPPAAP